MKTSNFHSNAMLCYTTVPALLAIRGHNSAHSFPTGPLIALPFISPFGLTITPALSSKYKYTPSTQSVTLIPTNIPLRRHVLRCRTTTAGITFFRSSGFPFLTVAITMSPTPAAGRRFSLAPIPLTEII